MDSHVLMHREFSLLKKRLMIVFFNNCRYEHQKVEFPAGGLSQTK